LVKAVIVYRDNGGGGGGGAATAVLGTTTKLISTGTAAISFRRQALLDSVTGTVFGITAHGKGATQQRDGTDSTPIRSTFQ
jgi:hypothetical protein